VQSDNPRDEAIAPGTRLFLRPATRMEEIDGRQRAESLRLLISLQGERNLRLVASRLFPAPHQPLLRRPRGCLATYVSLSRKSRETCAGCHGPPIRVR
jgi:hypothetical protein